MDSTRTGVRKSVFHVGRRDRSRLVILGIAERARIQRCSRDCVGDDLNYR